MKHGFSLMVRDAIASLPGALFALVFGIQGRKFQKQRQNLCHQGRNINY